MVNAGKRHTNGSMFYVTLQRMDYYNKRNVGFGRIVKGLKIFRKMNKFECSDIKNNVKISDAGVNFDEKLLS